MDRCAGVSTRNGSLPVGFAIFLRRAGEERSAAERASDPRARQSHLDLAERYADAARTLAEAIKLVDADPAQITSAPILQPEFRILP